MERKYQKPPIVEVVCEFRFIPSEPWDLTVPGLVYGRMRKNFPIRRQVRKTEMLEVRDAAEIRPEIRIQDWMRFLREDEKAFVQIGPDLIAVNHLEPYPTWEGFEPIVHQCFEEYSDTTKPKGVRRIGLRYINRIELASEQIELEDYFLIYPHVGPDLPQQFPVCIAGIEVPYQDGRDTLRLQLTSAEPKAPGNVAFLLDLDYFLARAEALEITSALEWVSDAHKVVQGAFEACLTDRLRKEFEPIEE